MKAPTMSVLVESIRTAAVRALAPFNIGVVVEHQPWERRVRALLRKLVDAPGHVWHGQVVQIEQYMDEREIVFAQHPSGRNVVVEHFLRTITEDALLKFMRHFTQVPQAGEIDWRPDFMMPEDYYAG